MPPTTPSTTPPFVPQQTTVRKLGFFERLGIGWKLTKVSLGVIRKEKSLLLLPLISFLIIGISWAVFLISIFLTVWPSGTFNVVVPFIVGLFVLYFLTYFVTTFFAAAVMGVAMIRLNGGNPTIGDGLRIAKQNIGRILAWSIISATVGVILRALAERAGWIGRIIAAGAGLAWGILTYLVLPSLIFEQLGPWAAVKRSGSLIKKTWGEAAGGYLTMSAIFVLFGLVGLLFIIIGVAIGTVTAIVLMALVAIVYWLILALVASAAQGVLVTALYRYATTGQVADGFPTGPLGMHY